MYLIEKEKHWQSHFSAKQRILRWTVLGIFSYIPKKIILRRYIPFRKYFQTIFNCLVFVYLKPNIGICVTQDVEMPYSEHGIGKANPKTVIQDTKYLEHSSKRNETELTSLFEIKVTMKIKHEIQHRTKLYLRMIIVVTRFNIDEIRERNRPLYTLFLILLSTADQMFRFVNKWNEESSNILYYFPSTHD